MPSDQSPKSGGFPRRIRPDPANPDATLLDAVLIFYRELGIRPDTVRKIAAHPMAKHKNAMRLAVAHILSEHFDERELQAILGQPQLGIR